MVNGSTYTVELYTITERFLARWMVESYSRYKRWKDVMVAHFVFLFLARTIFRETSTEIDVKNCLCYCKKQVDNYFPWSILWSGIEMTSKCSDLCSKTRLSCDSWFWLDFWTFDVISKVDLTNTDSILDSKSRLDSKIDHRWRQNVVKTKIKVAHDIMISSFAIRMNFTWQWCHNCFRSKLLSTRCEMSNARSPPCARKYARKGKNLFNSKSLCRHS